MTLLELAEPLFQYVCRLNRAGRKSAATPGDFSTGAQVAPSVHGFSLDYGVVQAEVKALFEDMAMKAKNDGRLLSQHRRMELPLLCFVDSMISDSNLSFAVQWNQNRLAYAKNELAGDQKFFDWLDENVNDPSEEASERLAVFYTCIGLGFTGMYFQQPEILRRTMMQVAARIRSYVDTDVNAKICQESYENVDTRNLVAPPSSKLFVLGIIFICFLVAAIAAYVVIYTSTGSALSVSLDAIIKNSPHTR